MPLAALTLLTSCARVGSSVCPRPVPYTEADQQRAADELDAIKAQGMTAIPRFMDDYKVERAALRACVGG